MFLQIMHYNLVGMITMVIMLFILYNDPFLIKINFIFILDKKMKEYYYIKKKLLRSLQETSSCHFDTKYFYSNDY